MGLASRDWSWKISQGGRERYIHRGLCQENYLCAGRDYLHPLRPLFIVELAVECIARVDNKVVFLQRSRAPKETFTLSQSLNIYLTRMEPGRSKDKRRPIASWECSFGETEIHTEVREYIF